MQDHDLSPVGSPRISGARMAAQALRLFQARIAITDRTNASALSDAAIDDALAYVELSTELKALADSAKLACRRFARTYETPHLATMPRRQVLERTRQRAQCRVTRLQAALRCAPDSWVAGHVEVAE